MATIRQRMASILESKIGAVPRTGKGFTPPRNISPEEKAAREKQKAARLPRSGISKSERQLSAIKAGKAHFAQTFPHGAVERQFPEPLETWRSKRRSALKAFYGGTTPGNLAQGGKVTLSPKRTRLGYLKKMLPLP